MYTGVLILSVMGGDTEYPIFSYLVKSTSKLKRSNVRSKEAMLETNNSSFDIAIFNDANNKPLSLI